ncbi:DUF3556 domain-containing protein [Nocardioides humi]|uniref:Uncharacterized protein n=1 Tax=Nocardioides humi TaxID=449461 RepID=A0ABN2ASG5_9ACTN|nr:DUF3556 domain-containing protein [Nocardioides humi]
MPFLTPVVPQVDPAEFLRRPHQERIRFLATFWAENGFGTQKVVHTIYIVKLLKNSVKYRIASAEKALGRSISSDRQAIELALTACHWLGRAVLLGAP